MLKIHLAHCRAERLQASEPGAVASERDDLMPSRDKCLAQRTAEEPGRARHDVAAQARISKAMPPKLIPAEVPSMSTFVSRVYLPLSRAMCSAVGMEAAT